MKGWIVYNGALRTEKILNLVTKVHKVAIERGMDVELVKNNELIPYFDEEGMQQIKSINNLEKPDYILFWDKDILLGKHLEKMGIRLFNPANVIEECDDKAYTFLKLSNLGIRLPKTIIAPFVYFEQNLSEEYISYIEEELGYPLIIKETHGSFGAQVYKIDNRENLIKQIGDLEYRRFIFQEFISSSYGRDVRVNLVGNNISGAMLREGQDDFRANITRGAKSKPYELSEEQKEIALKAHKALRLDFSGIDLLFDEEEKPVLCEVNSNPNFLSFENTTNIDYTNQILDYIMEQVK